MVSAFMELRVGSNFFFKSHFYSCNYNCENMAENKGTYALKACGIDEDEGRYPEHGDVGGRYEGKWAQVGK